MHKEECLPLISDFQSNPNMPSGEKLAHRIYPERFDITPFIRDGENVIAVEYEEGDTAEITVTVPEGTRATLCIEENRINLDTGTTKLSF